MAADDLSAPLGQGRTPRRPTVPLAIPRALVAVLSISVVVVAGWAMVMDDPFGGEPMTVAPIALATANPGKKPDEAAARPAGPAAAERPNRYDGPPVEATTPPAPPGKTVTIIDGSSGKRQEIVIPANGSPGPPDSKPSGVEQRLTESSKHGAIPKVAPDGARAADVYARPVKAIAGKPNAPRIAIVVGGLGVGAGITNEALGKLPGPVTFAFAPYGSNLEQLVLRARNGGHEILLHVPMEPFDYPDNDPGPQTLLTSLDAGANIDRLHWLMSRFQGYVGIANHMGGRFTSSDAALAPVLREASKRGLIYLDDGSSQRSVAGQIAGANNLAFAKADLVIDAVPTGADVERALGRLETMARERGIAVGMASALPVSIERIAKWAKAAEGRGVLLVPITAVAKRSTDEPRQTTENRR
jgi:polysaccharide deacetylase 2 family uncharacterized protein YibQ